MSGTCIAEWAATWTCRVSQASMEWARSLGCFACSAPLHIAAPCAGIASSHFAFTAASLPRSNPLNRERNLIPSRIRLVFHPEHYGSRRLTFLTPKVLLREAMEFAL